MVSKTELAYPGHTKFNFDAILTIRNFDGHVGHVACIGAEDGVIV